MKARRTHLPSATSRRPGSGCAARSRAGTSRGRRHISGGRGTADSAAGAAPGIPGVFLGGVLVFLVAFHLSWVPEARVGHRLAVAPVQADVLLREAENGSIVALQDAAKAPAQKPQARARRHTPAPTDAPGSSLRPIPSHRVPKGIHTVLPQAAPSALSLPPSVTGRSGAIVPVAYSKAPEQRERMHPALPVSPSEPGRPEDAKRQVAPPAEVTDLRGADLTGADLTGAKLAWAKLTGAKLAGAKLTGAALTEADLWLADLRGADLRGADLTGARMMPPERPGLPRPDIATEARGSGPMPQAPDPRQVPAILPASAERKDLYDGEGAF